MTQQVVLRTSEMQRIEAQRGRPMDEILRDLYEVQGLTLEEVGKNLGITKGAVSHWLARFGIQARKSGPAPAATTEAIA